MLHGAPLGGPTGGTKSLQTGEREHLQSRLVAPFHPWDVQSEYYLQNWLKIRCRGKRLLLHKPHFSSFFANSQGDVSTLSCQEFVTFLSPFLFGETSKTCTNTMFASRSFQDVRFGRRKNTIFSGWGCVAEVVEDTPNRFKAHFECTQSFQSVHISLTAKHG